MLRCLVSSACKKQRKSNRVKSDLSKSRETLGLQRQGNLIHLRLLHPKSLIVYKHIPKYKISHCLNQSSHPNTKHKKPNELFDRKTICNRGVLLPPGIQTSCNSSCSEETQQSLLFSSSPSPSSVTEPQPNVLHEILRHSLPTKIFEPLSDSFLSTSSKWVLPHDPTKVSCIFSDAQNPLRAYVSLPQVSFGPKRWQLPEGVYSFSASTANDLRRDKYTHVNPEKLKAVAEGLSRVGMVFMVATTIVFGGAALTCGLATSKLELHDIDDIKTKGKDLVQPKLEMFREQFGPLRVWAKSTSKKWHFEKNAEVKESPFLKELSKQLGAKTPN